MASDMKIAELSNHMFIALIASYKLFLDDNE